MITFFDLIMGIIISWIASLLAFTTLPFQHWLNSRLRSLSPFPFRKVGLNGTWIATFTLVSNGHKEKREEIIKVNHLYGGELRGKIRDRQSGTSYKFQGKLVFNDIVGHYGSVANNRIVSYATGFHVGPS